MDDVATVAGQAVGSVSALRFTVRRSPIAMSLVMLGLGYLIGTILTPRPHQRLH